MTKCEIISLAREAGLVGIVSSEGLAAFVLRFAALVAAAEREACANLCDATQRYCSTTAARSMLMEAATAIRARSNT